jgi:AGCS family alanine or glycine:cation symporter
VRSAAAVFLPHRRREFAAAFSFDGGAGGIMGFITSKSISEGFARGILSNEAGAGTSSFAHTRDSDTSPATSGVCGILEVLFDTVILCTISGVALLVGDNGYLKSELGMSAVCKIFTHTLGSGASVILFVCILCFALSTIICQYYYGGVCAEYIFGKKYKIFYFPIFLISCGSGLFFSSGLLIPICDTLLFLMSVITVFALLKNRARIKELTSFENLL